VERRVPVVAVACLACAAALTAGADNIRVARQRGGQVIEIVSGAGKCLDVHEPDQFNNGGRVQVWQCNGSKQQEWFLDRDAIRTSAGKCLDVHSDEQYRDGARVQIWDCNGLQQQQWKVTDNAIVSGARKCLDVPGELQHKDGAPVQVWQCNGGPPQRWTVRPKKWR